MDEPDFESGPVAQAVAGLAADGYAIVPGFLGMLAVAALAARALALDAAGELKPAAIGHGVRRIHRKEIRGDRTRWLAASPEDESEALLFTALEGLRSAINRTLQLGLFEFEGHFAIYSPGAGYVRHRDVFRGETQVPGARVVTCVLYLNAAWRVSDGGELRLYVDETRSLDVVPDGGTLVTFLADRFEHEVLLARRERLSVNGWFRRRPFDV